MTQDSQSQKRRKHMAVMDDKKGQAMTDEELIDGLRKNALWVTTHDAADRIEQLLESIKGLSQAWATVAVTREVSEGKLAKAYDIIARIVAIAPYGDEYDEEWHMTYAAAKEFLAELEKTE